MSLSFAKRPLWGKGATLLGFDGFDRLSLNGVVLSLNGAFAT
ncbi:MAG: hypothetical protein VKI82_14980 [Leptolyngbya sp.]|nr:hypothetical protein [Leptolyngbya sp.]